MNLDAILVLANLMNKQGILNEESSSRAILAADLFFKTNARYIITTGCAYREDTDLPIAHAFANYLQDRCKVPFQRILKDINARDTVGDAYYTTANITLPLKLKKIIIVTSNYHVNRTSEIFDFIFADKINFEVVGANVPCKNGVYDKELESINAFRTTFDGVMKGNLDQIFERMRKSHPFYNGDVYDQAI